MDAATYAELVAAEQAAATALDDWRTKVGTFDQIRAYRAELGEAYRAADAAREAAFVAFNATLKDAAVAAATAAYDSSADEAMSLANMIIGARKVWEYVGATPEAAMQYAMRAVEEACGRTPEHFTIGFEEQ